MDAKELKEDYFDNASDEFVDFLERIGEEGVKRQEQSFWNIRERCQKLTSLIVTGVAGVTMWLIADGLKSAFFYEMLCVAAVWFACGAFIVSCQGNLRFQSREELALAPPGRFFCIMNQSFDYVKLCLKLYLIEIVSTKLLTMRFGAQSIGNQFWSVQSPQKPNG